MKNQTRDNNEKSKFLSAHSHTQTFKLVHICPTNEAECQTSMHTFVVSKDLHECWQQYTPARSTKRMRTHWARRTFSIYAGFFLLFSVHFFRSRFQRFCFNFFARAPVRLVTLLQFITLTFSFPPWRRRRISKGSSIRGLIKNENLLERRWSLKA